MIFNRDNNGSQELYLLTGSFAAGNDFSSMVTDIELETETVIRFIGQAVYDRALASYRVGDGSDAELVCLVQRPIALFATLRYLQSNLTSHDGSGRKVQLDSNTEKMAFEWMVDRDDYARLQKAYKAIDVLLLWLERTELEQWMGSPQRAVRTSLLVDCLDRFEKTYYIEGSYRFYYILCPILQEVQVRLFPDPVEDTVQDMACAAIVLHAMSIALTRFSLTVLPEGVMKRYSPSSQTIRASESARQEAIDRAVKQLREESDDYLSRISLRLQNINNPYEKVDLMPHNSTGNKFFTL